MIAWSKRGVSMAMRWAILSLMLWAMCWLSAIAPARPARAQAALPRCYQRPLQVENTKPIWVENKRFCVERVIALPPGEDDALALTALAFGDDGALYATAPLRGEVWRFVDGDGDDLPDANTARVILSGLRRPNALAWLDGALYVVASAEFLRWQVDGTAQTLVDDLPTGGGYWNGGLAFDGEGNAYVGSGAPCAVCAARALESANPRASILRIPAAGTWEVYATGIRQPAGLAWAAGALWATDTANDGQPDELNRIIPGGDYGWPACVSGAPACAESLPPALTLPPGSVPLALLRYEGAAFPELVGSLLFALAGEPNAPLGESGFSLAAVSLAETDAALALEYLVPQWPAPSDDPRAKIALLNTGIWPRQIFGIAIDAHGWIYFSLSGGQIFVLRPP